MIVDTFTASGAWKPRFLSPSSFEDYVGNVFIGYVELSERSGDFGWVKVRKIRADGVIEDIGTRRPLPGKCDQPSIFQVGSDIWVLVTVHIGDLTTQLQLLEPFIGVCSPYPEGVKQQGAVGAYYLEDSVDYDRIQTMITTAMANVNLNTNTQSQRVIDTIQAKARAAIDQAFSGAQGSYEVYSQLVNTAYQGALAAIRATPRTTSMLQAVPSSLKQAVNTLFKRKPDA